MYLRTDPLFFFRQARAAIIMYDVTRPNSFANLRKWFKLVRENGRPDISIALVGNKTDQEEMRQVSATQGERLRQEENCIFFESSAKGDSNVYKYVIICNLIPLSGVRGSKRFKLQ